MLPDIARNIFQAAARFFHRRLTVVATSDVVPWRATVEVIGRARAIRFHDVVAAGAVDMQVDETRARPSNLWPRSRSRQRVCGFHRDARRRDRLPSTIITPSPISSWGVRMRLA